MAPARQEEAHRLWDELAGFPASEIDQACLHTLRTISDWVGADNAAWIGTTRFQPGAYGAEDWLHGWRAKIIVHLHPPRPIEAASARRIERQHRGTRVPEDDNATTASAMARSAGEFRVHRLRDGFVDFTAFQKTAHYRNHYRRFGVADRLWVAFPVNSDAESFFIFDKRGRGRFSSRQAEIAGYALRGLMWFHRQLLCGHGLLVAQTPLTAAEGRVMRMLLTSRSEKEIAVAIGQSPHTTRHHAKEIYRKFGVNGRTGLMAVWLAAR